MNTWAEKDLKYVWHPCSLMKDYETLPPIVIEKGEPGILRPSSFSRPSKLKSSTRECV